MWLCRIITIHNNPDDLKAPARFKHLKYTLADVDTENITPFFAPSFDFIEEAREAKQGTSTYTPPQCLLSFIDLSLQTSRTTYSGSFV
jgi:hypothetical protein